MSKEVICGAISTQSVISFSYTGAARTVEPHALGYDRGGHLTLSAWQLSGGSGQGWRDFRFDRMRDIVVTDVQFPTTRPGYNPNDSTLTQIVCRI